ncbi:MAG: UDP-N-acetylmuramoyl-L-alanine--D-glutamate ligase [Actinomycetota bacterium]
MARDHRHHPVLDHLGNGGRRRCRTVLCRLGIVGRAVAVRYLLLGASLRGLDSVANTVASEGHDLVLFDQETTIEPPAGPGTVTVVEPPWTADYLSGVDRVVTSPWFSAIEPPLSDAINEGIDVITEAGFGLEHLTIDYAAVTGTNGKTTVTEVATAMLSASGVHAIAVGNIGTPVSGLTDDDADVAVLELSSYQLLFMGAFKPKAAALLNIAQDHLDWHGTVEAYIAAKAAIFAGMDEDGVLAYNVDDPIVVEAVEAAPCSLVPCSGISLPQDGNGVDGSDIVIGGHRYNTTTTDPSYRFNLVAAATIAMAVGATRSGVAEVLETFTQGAHRRQVVAVVDGVTWVDDSKATNPHATVAAAGAFTDVILLAGGQNKDLDLSILTDLPSVHTLIAFGEAGPQIAALAQHGVIVEATLASAVAKAAEIATDGDTVLLAPGCASFDEFTSYAHRGDVFTSLVRALRHGP